LIESNQEFSEQLDSYLELKFNLDDPQAFELDMMTKVQHFLKESTSDQMPANCPINENLSDVDGADFLRVVSIAKNKNCDEIYTKPKLNSEMLDKFFVDNEIMCLPSSLNHI